MRRVGQVLIVLATAWSVTLHTSWRRDNRFAESVQLTQTARAQAIQRGLNFIYRTASDPRNFADWGHDYLWCFYSIASTSQDPMMRRLAWTMGSERARQWRRLHPTVHPDDGAGAVTDLAFGSDAADRLGVADEVLKEKIRRAASRFSAPDYLNFDPRSEPPPTDVPENCRRCDARNQRGSSTCERCGGHLKMRSRYDVWYDALITTYTGDQYGVMLGAHYADVLRWLPVMRPYCVRERVAHHEFYDTVYAITHLVYTLNDYSKYRLSPRWLPQEFEFLKANLQTAIAADDPETVGEFLDSLKSFGLTTWDRDLLRGIEYLLHKQNSDGSWGDIGDTNIYNRYHPTWTAIDGLREYAWQGEGLSFPSLKGLLEKWIREPIGADR